MGAPEVDKGVIYFYYNGRCKHNMLLFDDNKIKMARMPGKKQLEKPPVYMGAPRGM